VVEELHKAELRIIARKFGDDMAAEGIFFVAPNNVPL
jgi:hypothetical protein